MDLLENKPLSLSDVRELLDQALSEFYENQVYYEKHEQGNSYFLLYLEQLKTRIILLRCLLQVDSELVLL